MTQTTLLVRARSVGGTPGRAGLRARHFHGRQGVAVAPSVCFCSVVGAGRCGFAAGERAGWSAASRGEGRDAGGYAQLAAGEGAAVSRRAACGGGNDRHAALRLEVRCATAGPEREPRECHVQPH